jgi:Fe-S cluster biogenesis protein NfuA|tara:strand:+ start:7115 stop:7594 length:480 start_codon:yes stop_codon:yes gene_type:complete
MSDVDDLAEAYRLQVEALIEKEAQKRITEAHDPDELARLRGLSLLSLVSSDDPDLVPALMARLGPVRAALDGHGGGLLISACDVKRMHSGAEALSLVIDLDGACVSCGAAPGTLRGIQDDLLMDEEVVTVRFAAAMLQWFDELQREFVLKHGGVTFVEV